MGIIPFLGNTDSTVIIVIITILLLLCVVFGIIQMLHIFSLYSAAEKDLRYTVEKLENRNREITRKYDLQ